MAQHRDTNIIDFDAARRRRALARLGATRHAASEEACKAIPTHRLEAMTAIAEWHERFSRYWAPAPGSNG